MERKGSRSLRTSWQSKMLVNSFLGSNGNAISPLLSSIHPAATVRTDDNYGTLSTVAKRQRTFPVVHQYIQQQCPSQKMDIGIQQQRWPSVRAPTARCPLNIQYETYNGLDKFILNAAHNGKERGKSGGGLS